MDHATLKQHLSLGLKSEVNMALAGYPREYTYQEWKKAATIIGLQLVYAKSQNKPAEQSHHPSGSNNTNQSKAQNYSRPQRTPAPTGARTLKTNLGAPRVPKEVVEQRKKDGLCYKCGKKGHFGRECKTGWVLALEVSPNPTPHSPRNSRKRKGKQAERDPETNKRQDSGKGPAV